MLHTIKYAILNLIRQKQQIFWLILFPVILGTLFKVAFSSMGEAESFDPIPVAVVLEKSGSSGDITAQFRQTTDALGAEGDDQFLDVIYCNEEEALKLLENKEVDGILTAGDRVELTLSANMNDQLDQSILESFVRQFNLSTAAVTDVAIHHPDRLAETLQTLNADTSFNREESLSAGSGDSYTQYFYNLLAMTCMFTCMSGLYISLHNQGNLSDLGARRNVSPMPKLRSILGELTAYALVNFICIMIGFLYINLVLKIDMTLHLPLVILTLFVSDLAGCAFGFFIGSLGHMSEGTKNGLATGISMICCFLSGLMMGSMRIIVDQICPVINYINPAALISDSLYCLANFDNYTRYTRDMVTLVVITVLFLLGGFLFTRRKRYASL